MVRLMNKRATMLANPSRYANPWKENQQKDFEKAMAYFKEAGPEDRNMFEVSNLGEIRATTSGLSIRFTKPIGSPTEVHKIDPTSPPTHTPTTPKPT